MMRRTLLTGAAALLGACATSRAPPTLERGLWRGSDGDFAASAFPEFGPGLFGFDYATNRVGPLTEDNGLWRMSSTLNGAGAPLAEVRRDGEALRIGARSLRHAPIRRVPFEVASGEVSISAEVAAPRGNALGTMLMIYGSGAAPKEAFDLWSFWFLSRGYAVITYDKRGSGRSTGDWRLSGLEALAADACAVIARARELLPAGLFFAWGASQAGWILPQLGAAGVIDAIIMHAGAAVKPGEQILSHVAAELRAYEFPEDEIARAVAYYALDTDVSRGVRPWSDIDTAFREASARGAEWLLAPPAAADAPERTMIRLMADFDPAPYWAANRAPMLALFGGKDWTVPAAQNSAALEAMTGGRGLTQRMLPNANHLMFIASTGVSAEYPTLSQLDPDYFAAIAAWLAR